MYCEYCGKKLNPGEVCSCQKGTGREYIRGREYTREPIPYFSGEGSGKPEKKPPENKKRGMNIYILISFLLLILGNEMFWYFYTGTDSFLKEIPIEFVTEYRKYISYGIVGIIFVFGMIVGIMALKKGRGKIRAGLMVFLNLLNSIAVCTLIGWGVYQNYEVLRLCSGEWSEASAQKVNRVYSRAEWDDPIRKDIQSAVLKRIEAIQDEYKDNTIDYASASSQLEAMSVLGFASSEAEEGKVAVEELESTREESGVNGKKVPDGAPQTYPTGGSQTAEANEKESETERITEKTEVQQNNLEALKQPETQKQAETRKQTETEKQAETQKQTEAQKQIEIQQSETQKQVETQKQTESEIIPQSGIHRYEYCLMDGTWEDAFWACLTKGGHLVTFETQEEFDYVAQDLLNKNQQEYLFFIGGRRDDNSQQYYWADETNALTGNPLNSVNAWNKDCWLHDEPSFEDTSLGLQENVLSIFYYDDLGKWVWNDVPNDLISAVSYYSGKVGYICEYED